MRHDVVLSCVLFRQVSETARCTSSSTLNYGLLPAATNFEVDFSTQKQKKESSQHVPSTLCRNLSVWSFADADTAGDKQLK